MTIANFVRPSVVKLANPETGVITGMAHVSQLMAFRNKTLDVGASTRTIQPLAL